MSLPAVLVLLCALALPAARRPAAALTLCLVQAGAVAAAMLWHGDAPAAVILLAGMPPLSWMVRRFGPAGATGPGLPVWLSLGLGPLLTVAAALAVLPATAGWPGPTRFGLTAGLTALLAGLLGMLSEGAPFRRALACLAAANGVLLAAAGAPDLPFVAVAVLALLGLAARLVVGGNLPPGAGA